MGNIHGITKKYFCPHLFNLEDQPEPLMGRSVSAETCFWPGKTLIEGSDKLCGLLTPQKYEVMFVLLTELVVICYTAIENK